MSLALAENFVSLRRLLEERSDAPWRERIAAVLAKAEAAAWQEESVALPPLLACSGAPLGVTCARKCVGSLCSKTEAEVFEVSSLGGEEAIFEISAAPLQKRVALYDDAATAMSVSTLQRFPSLVRIYGLLDAAVSTVAPSAECLPLLKEAGDALRALSLALSPPASTEFNKDAPLRPSPPSRLVALLRTAVDRRDSHRQTQSSHRQTSNRFLNEF